ncbi:macrophage mannose receptor 1-like [Halichoeres trimaculatus]|uniref:macrophage mannose receptor 1-like n=1 Tax=Halichoeres trimaculatus TaxID=147232 RepID=UPI003D9DBE60
MKTVCAAFLLLIQTQQCLASDDSPFQLTNKASGFCLVKTNNLCNDIRWTTGDRLLVPQRKKCLGAQGKSVGSDVTLYDCDETSELQKWECKNETVLALKDQELYVQLTADNTAILSRTVGPKSHLTISGTPSGACTRTYREIFSIGGNAAGMPCMFPFQYRDQWYTDCTTTDTGNLWCAVETRYQSERWGFCPVTSKADWNVHPITGAYYQLNILSALTWSQAETSCRQQGASLLSFTDPHEQAYVTALLGTGGAKLWIGLVLDPELGWKWSNGRPYSYMKWDTGHPLPDPGQNCAIIEPAVRYSWQSSLCSKKLGYICYSKAAEQQPTQAAETGFCSSPWIPYNGHCFYLNRTEKTWSDAQRDCRSRGGDLVTVRNVEDQSFVISQLGYTSTDELWIGLNDRKTEGLFEWSDHSTVGFTSWEFGKPAVSTDVKDCILIRGENGNWADRVCAERHGFICMKQSATRRTGHEVELDVGCKPGWRRHGSYCFLIGTQAKTFDEAKDNCKSSDSYLADVSNRVDNAFLISLVGMRPETHFWLGLSNQKNGRTFVWTNTNTVRFTHWNANMPGHRQGCAAMRTGTSAGLWDLLPCTNREKYICKHLAEGAVVTPVPPVLTTPSRCPPDWTPLETRNYCVKLFKLSRSSRTQARTWHAAEDYCTAIGGDLLSIHSQAELQLLAGLRYRMNPVWIGLRASDSGSGYVWSDGSPLQYQHWSVDEPNNKRNVEFCVELVMDNIFSTRGSWKVVHCEKDLAWLCQVQTGVTLKPAPDPLPPAFNMTSNGWIEWNGNQYYLLRTLMVMAEARDFCKTQHGDLVTLNSEAENIFLWKLLLRQMYGSFWIGLTVDLDGTYEWIDGSPAAFEWWDDGQPNFQNNDENCAIITLSLGLWKTSSCGLQNSVICKRNSTRSTRATVQPTVLRKGGCPPNWKRLNSKCYMIINKEKKTWEEARTHCRAMGGNLASILSQDEQVFLTGMLIKAPTTDLWIGLNCRKNQQHYWTDGQPKKFYNWNTEGNFHIRHDKTRECIVLTSNPEYLGSWTKEYCNKTNGYVCLRSVDPSFPDTTTAPSTDYVKIGNDSVRAVSEKMTWYNARKHCQSEGASLASVRNSWSKAYIELIALNGPVWIGLNTRETGGYFRYMEGWHLTIINWDVSEPTNLPCVYVNAKGKWKTTNCDMEKASVCMKTTDVPPTESSEYPGLCPDGPDMSTLDQLRLRYSFTWVSFKANCYLILPDRLSWPDASAKCATHGGTLVSIEDPSEQAFIYSYIQVFRESLGNFWIGLYITHKGQLRWLDKAVVDYTNWEDGQPSSFRARYTVIRAWTGKWVSSNSRYAAICKAPKVLLQAPPTTENPTVKPETNSGTLLPVVLVICVTALLIVIIVVLFKRSGRSFPVPRMSNAFHNPLFSAHRGQS